MDCDHFFADIDGTAADGEAPISLDARRHLLACPHCRRLNASLERGRAILASITPANVSGTFYEGLQGRIERFEERRRRRRAAGRLSLVGAVGGAAAVLGLNLLSGGAELERSSAAPFAPAAWADLPPASASPWQSRESLLPPVPRIASEGWTGRWPRTSGEPHPVLLATPSWTFTATPVVFRLVSSYPSGTLPQDAP